MKLVNESRVWNESESIAIMEYIIAGYSAEEAKAKVMEEMCEVEY